VHVGVTKLLLLGVKVYADIFEIDVFPVVPAEEGLERLRRTMSSTMVVS
jgi:hypothetical protein